MSNAWRDALLARVAALEAENERLREALSEKDANVADALVETYRKAAARPVRTPDELDAMRRCKTPYFHETHRYCPSCPWTEDDDEALASRPGEEQA